MRYAEERRRAASKPLLSMELLMEPAMELGSEFLCSRHW